ncbi:hypothetical protein PENTCL1PPCAC_28499, partial [Pristionchus entomophagus]
MSELLSGLGNLTKSLTSNISTYEIRKISEKVQGMVMNYTEAEQMVRDATNEDPWGPTGPQMKEIAHLTYQYDNFHQVMNLLWKRMFEDNKYAWRRVYKSLMLLNHLLAHGSERVIGAARDHQFQMRSLEHYKCTDEKGKDQGINIRHRVKLILELVGDEEKLRAERKKAKNDDKSKFQGFSADDMKMGRGGSYNSKDRDDSYDTRKPSFEDDEPPRDVAREVNSFSFPAGKRESNSPELGFRDERKASRNHHDDDDFGDFASARTTTKNNGTPTAQTTNVPRISGPGSVPSQKIVAVPAPQKDAFDLLGLDMTSPSSTALPTFASPSSISSAASLPRPPSGGPSPNGNGNFVDDLFGVPHTSTTNNESNDLFADWSVAPSAAPAAAAAPFSVGFADFGAFSSVPSVAPVAAAPLSFHPSPTPLAPMGGADDLFGLNVSSPISAAPLNSTTLTPSMGFDFGLTPSSTQSTPMKPVTATTTTPSKVGSTWSDLGMINLDNLGSKGTPTKSNVPMNQMAPKPTNNQIESLPSHLSSALFLVFLTQFSSFWCLSQFGFKSPTMKSPSLLIFFVVPLAAIGTKRVRIINWYTNTSELANNNKLFPHVVYRDSEVLGFLCKSGVPAAIHLVREEHIGRCRSDEPPITSCPNPRAFFTLDLESYEAGIYFITSFSTFDDDGRDEQSGGFCRSGLVFPVNIVNGKAPDFEEDKLPSVGNFSDQAREELRISNAAKDFLDFEMVNEVNRRYVE